MNNIGFVYRWSDSYNGKYYIGSHCVDISDGYIGSGYYFKKAYKKKKSVLRIKKIKHQNLNYPEFGVIEQEASLDLSVSVSHINNMINGYKVNKYELTITHT